MDQFKKKKVFLTEEELVKCRESMMQHATTEQLKEAELERLSEEFKAKKKAFESDILTAKTSMRENLTLVQQKFKYIDVPYTVFSDSTLKKEFHIQTDDIDLLEVNNIPPFANPELDFGNYCVVLINSEERIKEVIESDSDIYSTKPVIINVPDLKVDLHIFKLDDDLRVVRFTDDKLIEVWNNEITEYNFEFIDDEVNNDIQDNEEDNGENE